MEKIEGYDEAEALTGEFEVIEPGGYICKVIACKEELSKSGKRMLVFALDIEEGKYKGYFKKRWDELNKQNTDPSKQVKYPSAGTYRQMVEGSDKALGFLKGVMTSFEVSNPGFKWDWNEKKLVNLKCGVIFGQEEYLKLDGSVGISTKAKGIRSVECIKNGNFKVPEIIKLPTSGDSFEGSSNFVSSDNDDLPF